ncbi:hypothetical protein Y032_0121g981 [Ancylostoma ceylanicum]|uniref:7TM GPCR serpentine receptor class x (Srx) domain-containing protein n=1 Tax=Ancylostoma ceylanicum TaxID=53326 RepID=A0A016TAE7_9BILA|nr:hypothetical protein Y032_0121g981 [Ancylostoma ceylanicum]
MSSCTFALVFFFAGILLKDCDTVSNSKDMLAAKCAIQSVALPLSKFLGKLFVELLVNAFFFCHPVISTYDITLISKKSKDDTHFGLYIGILVF